MMTYNAAVILESDDKILLLLELFFLILQEINTSLFADLSY